MSNDNLSVQFVGRLIDELTNDAAMIQEIIGKTEFVLLGKTVDITVKRKVYESAAGDILEKGKVKVEQVQSDESNEQDVKVGEENKEQGEGESAEECCKEGEGEKAKEIITTFTEEEQEVKEWWNKHKDNWCWSGCISGDTWNELYIGARKEIWKLYKEGVVG